MPLAPGQSLSHYRIIARIGEGGMGVVWRASDSTLGRDVAIKVLPERFTSDPERLARFEREARLLAALNHPNIASIYGLHVADGVRFLAMELVEGEDLADRLARGPIPVAEALPVALQIAEALEHAHERGVIHRDLKPANVKLGSEGKVKVLDFGLAKALEGDAALSSSSPTTLSQSPTLGGDPTSAHVLLGTAAYMSPEQARGRAADRRADIWSFGVVLMEALTGQRLFEGETISDTLAAVLKTDPDWSALPRETPSAVKALLRRCLERDAKQRLRDIGEARITLERAIAGAEEPAAVARAARPRVPAVAWAAAGLVAGALLTPLLLRMRAAPPPEAPLRRFTVGTAARAQGGLVISPDGRAVAYASGGRLWVREMDHLEPRLVAEEPGLRAPFWSPDSKSIGYVAGNRLSKVALVGGERQLVSATSQAFTNGSGASWGEDGTITLSHAESDGLLRVSALGGDAKVILAADTTRESDLHDPSLLPKGRGVLFVAHRIDGEPDNITLLANGRRRVLLQVPGQAIADPCYAPSGHLLFARFPDNRGIWAVPFSLDRLEVTGAPFLVAANGGTPSVSNDGTLVYMPYEAGDAQYVWVDRVGREIGIIGPPVHGGGTYPALSRDGTRIAIAATENSNSDLWILDTTRDTRTRLSFEPGDEANPEWSPDGTRIVYHALARGSGATSQFAVLSRAADGSGVPDTLARPGFAPVFSPDGRYVVFTVPTGATGGFGLDVVALDGARAPVALVRDNGLSIQGHVSPDGKYVAYASSESGAMEIYLRRFPSGEGKWQVSNGGGHWPRWTARGDRLFYAHENDIMEVSIQLGASPSLGQPQKLFTRAPTSFPTIGGWPTAFDVDADGNRFVIVRETENAEHQNGFVVVQNWASEFRRKQ